MVWKETGKFGVHTGRTLRKSAEQSFNRRDHGFLIKTVTNPDINFTDEDIRRCLKKFQIQDGLHVENVVKESRKSRHRRLWHVGGRAIHDNSLLYSLGKRKRWLMSTVLREQIPADYDSQNDYNVVLVERESLNNSSWYCSSPRLKRGDCNEVVDGESVRKPKRRRFAHVGDLRSSSDKTEILYEVNHSETTTSWPSFLQYDWSESRDRNKARCKQKGTKNKRRMWGEFSKNELGKTSCQYRQERIFDQDIKTSIEEEEEMALSVDNSEHCSGSMLEHDFVQSFDIGNYIWEALTATPPHSGVNDEKKHDERTPSTVNPASSQIVQRHGKGCVVHIDSVDSLHNGYHDNTVFETPGSGVNAPLTTDGITYCKAVSVNVDIERGELDPCALQAQFGEMYKESECVPRRFSINCPTGQSTMFVITCWPSDALNIVDNRTERVVVTVISNSVPSKKSYDCKELLRNFFGVSEQGGQLEEEPPCSSLLDQSQYISVDNCPCGVAVMPFDLLYDINRWSCEVSQSSLALPDGLESNAPCYRSKATMANGESNVPSIPETVLCEICFCEFYLGSLDEARPVEFSCTAMKSCSHWFCNECWKTYLTAQLQQGKIIIKCPAHDCDTPVDDVTLMGLVPDRFLMFLTMRQEKTVEMNSEWQWCPGNKCNLVVKATTHKGRNKIKEEVDPVPICCKCGHEWCFACQEEPHWPASCAEAAFFRSQTETYEKLIRTKTGGITSVNVKRCPHCHYPIEKHQGCPHMSCIMCKGEFCWTCLGNWANHHFDKCVKDLKQEEEVELANHIGSTRFNRHLRVAIANRVARAGPILYEKYSAVKKLEGVLQTHNGLFEDNFCGEKGSMLSASFSLLSLYNSHEVPKYLKASADFKFQAHFVIEGVSILMAVSKTKSCHGKLQRLVSTLLFVAERVEDIANNRKLYSETEKVHFKRLMKAGKRCIDCIRKLCIKAHQN